MRYAVPQCQFKCRHFAFNYRTSSRAHHCCFITGAEQLRRHKRGWYDVSCPQCSDSSSQTLVRLAHGHRHRLCAIPVEPRVALLLLNGSFLGCLGPLLTFAAAIESRTIFSAGCEPSNASVKGIIGRLAFSDFDAIVSVRNRYQTALQKQGKASANKYLDSVHASGHAVELLEQQRHHLLLAMSGSGLACADSLDDLNAVARACIVAAFWPSVGVVSDASGSTTRCNCAQGAASIQQSCVLVGTNLPKGAIFTYADAMASANGKVGHPFLNSFLSVDHRVVTELCIFRFLCLESLACHLKRFFCLEKTGHLILFQALVCC